MYQYQILTLAYMYSVAKFAVLSLHISDSVA